MPRLIRIDSGDEIGTISEKQHAFLIAQLEEENEEDADYYIDRDTLELLADNDADPDLLELLEKGLAGDDEMDISFEPDAPNPAPAPAAG
jgi:hypothetical protein